MTRGSWTAAALLTAVSMASATPAAASSPYRVEVTESVLITGSAWLLAGAGQLIQSEGALPDVSGYRPDQVNGLDRLVIGPKRDAAAQVSDVLLLTLISAPYVVDAVDVAIAGGPVDGWGIDGLVILETQGVAAAVTQLVKLAIPRPRPFTYAEGFVSRDHDDERSFFSGHTSLAFASAVALASTYARRHDDASVGWVWGGAMAMATTVGVLRVHGRRHFWSDVITGAAVGALIGWVVPHLHARRGADRPGEASGALRFSLSGGW